MKLRSYLSLAALGVAFTFSFTPASARPLYDVVEQPSISVLKATVQDSAVRAFDIAQNYRAFISKLVRVDRPVPIPPILYTGPACPEGGAGKRVQAVYASVVGQPSRYASMVSGIRTAMTLIDARFDDSAKRTGGHRFVRWVMNSCTTSVAAATISVAALNEEAYPYMRFRNDLASQGYNDPNRKYLVWIDPGALDAGCGGWADHIMDDRPTLNNRNNAGDYPYPFYATTRLCSSYPTPEQTEGLAAHELMHSLGAVQNSAPHYEGSGHCSDGYDTLCHTSSWRCTNLDGDVRLFDCGNDDYFYAGKPPAGNYLATHWNTADSSFLINSDWPS